MPRSMIPFPYSPWPFLDFGSDPDPNGPPPVPNVPGVTIPWSTLPPIAPPPSPPPSVVSPPETAPAPPPPPVAQPPRNPSLADILAPWIRPPDAEPPPPALPPSETPGLDKAIARINAPTPGFDLTPGLGGFSQPPMWSLPPPPKLLPMPPLPVPMGGGGLGALGSTLPPTPAPSPLILAGNVSAPTMEPPPGIGPGIPETLMQIGRRLMPYATEMGAAIGHTLPSVGAAGAGALAAAPILLAPNNTGPTTIDLGDGLRTSLPPGQRYVPIERRVAPGVFGSDVGATWKQVPGLYGEVDPGRGVLVDPDRLREALGDEAADRVLNTPGIMPMAKPRPGRRIPRYLRGQSTAGSGGDQPPEEPTPPAEAILDAELRRLARKYKMEEDSETTRRILNNLNMRFRDYISRYVQGKVMRKIPDKILDSTVRDVLESANSAALKALKQERFAK